MKTILAAIDFSPFSSQVLTSAEELARDSRARVLLLHVIQIPATMLSFQLVGGDVTSLIAELEQEALARLETLRPQFPRLELLTRTAVGRPAAEILREARAHAADVIVVGSRGHTALYELLLGSTTRELLAQAACPVVVIPYQAATAEAVADSQAELAVVARCADAR